MRLCSWMVSSISAVVMPPSSGQLMWRTKMLCVHADAEHQQKAFQRKLRKVRELTDQMLRQWAEMHLGQRTVDQLHDGLAACGRLAPFSSELRKINIMQAISAAVNTTRNKISHGLVLSFSIILLYRYSSINLYYSTQPA